MDATLNIKKIVLNNLKNAILGSIQEIITTIHKNMKDVVHTIMENTTNILHQSTPIMITKPSSHFIHNHKNAIYILMKASTNIHNNVILCNGYVDKIIDGAQYLINVASMSINHNATLNFIDCLAQIIIPNIVINFILIVVPSLNPKFC